MKGPCDEFPITDWGTDTEAALATVRYALDYWSDSAIGSETERGFYDDALAALDAIASELERLHGISHQGHTFQSHRFSFDDVLLLLRAMGGDEGAARMAERAQAAEAEVTRLHISIEGAMARINELEQQLGSATDSESPTPQEIA